MTFADFWSEALMPFWVFVAVFVTLSIYSFLYRDNPLYKLSEHLFVGIATGFFLVTHFWDMLWPNLIRPFLNLIQLLLGFLISDWNPLRAAPTLQDWLILVPVVLSICLLARFIPSYAWLSRWPMALVVGTFSGVAVVGFAQADILPQLQANILPLHNAEAWQAIGAASGAQAKFFAVLTYLGNPIMVAGLFTSLVYFFFSTEHKGAVGRVARIGVFFLMLSFGASYGNTVMTRFALFIERVQYMLQPESYDVFGMHLRHEAISGIALVLVVAIVVIWSVRQPKTTEEEAA